MKVKDRVKQSYDDWVQIFDYECGLARTQKRKIHMDSIFSQFLRNVVLCARKDERDEISAKQRIEALQQFVGQPFPYMMPVNIFGYDSAEQMQKELEEYAPELLKDILIHQSTDDSKDGSVGRTFNYDKEGR